MTYDEFIDDVKRELLYLRANATQEERDRLDADRFNHALMGHCIYGQMTGSCRSDRAMELYPKKYDAVDDVGISIETNYYVPFEQQSLKEGDAFTALEKYLYIIGEKVIGAFGSTEKQREVIAYLKGETDTIEL